ncbi:MAG: hypothetical protein GY816_14325 [Cytophagales bacterium]|nr:hypothetical protein [Cytophagales bacterium]
MENQEINDSLMEAVSNYNLEAVKECLEAGADPNYTKEWDGDYSSAIHQPTTPLRMVMFRISDNLLEDEDLIQFGKIATLLLQKGPNLKPALEIAESRYGKHKPNGVPSPFMDVWQIVAEG